MSGVMVIAKTDPPMLSVIAAPVCWLRRACLVTWLQDIFPGSLHVRIASTTFNAERPEHEVACT